MSRKHRILNCIFSIILIFSINLFNVHIVFADDVTPPPPATEEPTQPPVEPTETPAPTETPSVRKKLQQARNRLQL